MVNGKNGPKNLFKRGKKGIYYVRWREDGQLKMQSTGETTLDKAKMKRDEILRLHLIQDDKEKLQAIQIKIAGRDAELKEIEDKKPALKLDSIWPEYHKSQNRPKSGESTLKRYKTTIKAFTKWLKKTYPDIKEMRLIETEHAEAYATHLEEKKLSPSSYNIYLNALTVVWATLWKKARLQFNPFAWDKKSRTGIQRRNIRAEVDQRKKRALTLEEVNTVIEKANGDYRTLLIILACTGQRLVDGVKLQWKDIDLQRGVISLIPQKTATRTGKQVFIPLLPQLRDELESMARHGRYILPDLVKAYNQDRTAISKKIRSIFDDAKLNAYKETNLDTGKAITETGAHSLRHSFVSIARLAGIPDAIIQQITGHESIEMIDHYTHFTPDIIAQLASKLPGKQAKQDMQLQAPPAAFTKKIKSLAKRMNANNWENNRAKILELLT